MRKLNNNYDFVAGGYDASRLDILDKHFEDLIKDNVIYGADYCLSRNGEMLVQNEMGSLCSDDEMPSNSLFNTRSIKNMFTAVAIMKLVEEGKLRISQPLAEFFNQFCKPSYDKITIKHLLTHTSGLVPVEGAFLTPYTQSPTWFMNKLCNADNTDWISAGLNVPRRSLEGTEWVYSNFGYKILEEIIEVMSGINAVEYITKNILEPLGMQDSKFETSQDNALYSTTLDLIKFGNMLLNMGVLNGIEVISRKALENMFVNQTQGILDFCWNAGGIERAFGLGFDLRHSVNEYFSPGSLFHEGEGGCMLVIDPKESMVAAWHVPYVKGRDARALHFASSIMWSGLI